MKEEENIDGEDSVENKPEGELPAVCASTADRSIKFSSSVRRARASLFFDALMLPRPRWKWEVSRSKECELGVAKMSNILVFVETK